MADPTDPQILKFYQAKADYERGYHKSKRTIAKNKTLSTDEKKRRLAGLRGRCPGCEMVGRSTFERKPGMLVATCPKGSGCPYSFTVNATEVESLRKEQSELETLNVEMETEVIKAKLDLLFGYETQANTLREFSRLRPRAEAVRTKLNDVQAAYWKIVTRAEEKDALLNPIPVKLPE